MLTLSYGFKKPQTNDGGDVVFPALEQNAQQTNDHTHNGVNSAKINTSDLSKTTFTMLAANWNSLGGGHYKQTVTLPGVLQFDDCLFTFRTTAGVEVNPSVVKVAATQMDVFFDDPSLDLTVYVG